MPGEIDETQDNASRDLTSDLMKDLTGAPSEAAAGTGAADAGAGAGGAAAGAAAGGAAGGDGKDKAGAAGGQPGAGAAKDKAGDGKDKSGAAASSGQPAGAGKGQPAAKAGTVADINPDDPKVSAADLRKHLKRVIEEKNGIAQTVQQKEAQAAELQKKIEEFSKKKVWTEADQALVDKSNKRLAELERDLYGRDYRQSPEFQDKYQKRYDRVFNQARKELIGMDVTVKEKNPDGDGMVDVQRKITEADVLAVVNAAPNARIAIAKKLFGEDRETVLTHARELSVIDSEAAEAIRSKQENYQSEVTKAAEESQKAQTNYQQFVKNQSEHFLNNNPDIFGTDGASPEAVEALQKGIAFVDACANASPDMSINERAARAAVVRGFAIAGPRLLFELKAARAEIARLTEENKGFRASDPGNAGEHGGGGAGGDGGEEPAGSDALAADFK